MRTFEHQGKCMNLLKLSSANDLLNGAMVAQRGSSSNAVVAVVGKEVVGKHRLCDA